MNNTQHTIKLNQSLLTGLLFISTSVAAANNDTVYIDSVHQWGAWSLDIEPAAGGLQADTTQALNARNSKLSLRTNSISALSPQLPDTIIVPAPLPTTPTSPGITPINPTVPIPVGGPGGPGGSSAIPVITPINPGPTIPIGGPGIPTGGPGA